MHFEHLVQINDPLNPLIDPVSHHDLWRGLVRYVQDPAGFVLGLDSCTITSRTRQRLTRELRFGRTVVSDTVTLDPEEAITCEIAQSPQYPAGTRTIRIEEPTLDEMFVRFTYELRPQGHNLGDERERRVRQLAYVAADVDVIRRIRRLLVEGEL